MQVDIPSHIEKLLFLHESLVIPGFGGFTATRTPATTDYVGGTVSAPSKTLAFSENLTIDDGILVNDIMLTHGINAEDASRVVAEFVEKMQSLLNQREIVTLPGVGRLYKNYVQKIQFLPDATNFNAASYGLPPLQFSPISRAREVSPDPSDPDVPYVAPAPPPPMPEPTFSSQRSGSASLGTALGIVFLLASLTAAIWYWQHKKSQSKAENKPDTELTENTPEPPVKETPEKTNVNTSPAKEETAAPEKTAAESLEEREKSVRDKVKNGRQCILVVATLSVKENADKLRNSLIEAGYEVYYVQKSGHQVGIQFYYTDPAEVQQNIDALKKLTGEKNILVKKR